MRPLASMPYLAIEVSTKNRRSSAPHLSDDVLEVRLAIVVVKWIYADGHALNMRTNWEMATDYRRESLTRVAQRSAK